MLNKWFKKNVNGDALIFVDDKTEVSQHKLSHLQLIMILNEQKSKFLVHNWCIRISLACKLIQKIEKKLKQIKSHNFTPLSNSSLYQAHYFIYLVKLFFKMNRISSPKFCKKLQAIELNLSIFIISWWFRCCF